MKELKCDFWLLKFCLYDGGFWFRLFGKGFSVVDREKHFPPFSIRSGKMKTWWIGKWSITFLD